MTNKTKAAIEEAAKLPTAEETLNTVVGDGCNFRKLFGDNDTDWVIKAIESHTQSHTEGLRERVKELEADNSRVLNQVKEINQLAKNTRANVTLRIIELETENTRLRDALEGLERITAGNPDYEFINYKAKKAMRKGALK